MSKHFQLDEDDPRYDRDYPFACLKAIKPPSRCKCAICGFKTVGTTIFEAGLAMQAHMRYHQHLEGAS